MRIRLVAIGHRLPAWVETGCGEYAARLPREWHFELAALRAPARPEGRPVADAMLAEAKLIEASLPSDHYRVVLDERGQPVTTAELAGMLRHWRQDDRSVAFVIGGADGLDPGLKAKADRLLALSALTLPHALARLLLLEQLYRAASLLQGHPYHRA
jgi:23S rRNA (pseudouridine1915-N3)-methyltransferase